MSELLGFHNHTWAEAELLKQKDPLNLFFVGRLAELEIVRDAFRDLVGWASWVLVDGNQWFAEVDQNDQPEVVHRHDWALASSLTTLPFRPRFHVRLYRGENEHATLGPIIGATVHHDTFHLCPDIDVADSFDAGYAARRLSNRYQVTQQNDGTPFSAMQCNGTVTTWNGIYYVVSDRQ